MNIPQTTGADTRAQNQPEAELLDVHAVARLLGLSVRSVWRLRDSGGMPAPVRLGRLARWSRVAVVAWVRAGCPRERRAAR